MIKVLKEWIDIDDLEWPVDEEPEVSDGGIGTLYFVYDCDDRRRSISTLGALLYQCNEILNSTDYDYHQRSYASLAILEWDKEKVPSHHLSAMFQEALGNFAVDGINDTERKYLLQRIELYCCNDGGELTEDSWLYLGEKESNDIEYWEAADIINSKLSEPIFDSNYAITEGLNESLTEDKHEELNQKIWDDNNELLPEVRKVIEKIVNKFVDNLREEDIPLDVKDVRLVGSNANYNYNNNSDLDVHIIADMSKFGGREEELAEKLYLAEKTLFNDKYDPEIRGIDVELYVEPYDKKETTEWINTNDLDQQ